MTDSKLVEHAEKELRIALGNPEDLEGWDQVLRTCTLQLVQTFADQPHSGMSLEMTALAFWKLARRLPLTPLTGEENEWEPVDPDHYSPHLSYSRGDRWYINKRCGRVFKEKLSSGENILKRYYDVEGMVTTYEGSEDVSINRTEITFPYDPSVQQIRHVKVSE